MSPWDRVLRRWRDWRWSVHRLPLPDAEERARATTFLQALQRVASPQASESWTRIRNDMTRDSSDDPRRFLRWDAITRTMFHEADPRELLFLRRLPDWPRWARALDEEGVGDPRPYYAYPRSSGNLVHQAYHLALFRAVTGKDLAEAPVIVEFGGGYGALCRTLFRLGFSGRYVIFDLPEMSALQHYYLSAPAIDLADRVTLCTDIQTLGRSLEGGKPAVLALWSMSEAPLAARRTFWDAIPSPSEVLVAYQSVFDDVDNRSYFKSLAASYPELVWREETISHLSGNAYLIGRCPGPGEDG